MVRYVFRNGSHLIFLRFFPFLIWNIPCQLGARLGVFVLFSSFRMADSPSAGSRLR